MTAPRVESSPPSQAAYDHAWLESVFREHYRAVVRWTRALGVAAAEVEDVAQQVFLIAERRREQRLDAPAQRAWLFAITRRACANHRRGSAREQARRVRLEPPAELPDPEKLAERAQAAAALQTFLDRLAEPQRLVFVLYDIEGLDAAEVGRMLDIRPDTVHARLRIARQKFAKFVERGQRRDRGSLR